MSMLLKCERCPWKNSCAINLSGNCLPDLLDEVPNVYSQYYMGKASMKEVEAQLILGGFMSVRKDVYTPDFMPRKPDLRRASIFEGVQSNIELNRMGQPFNPVSLVECEGKYYIWKDGHRRVSVAKQLGYKTVLAQVTPLMPFRARKIRVEKPKKKMKEVLRRV